MIRSRWLFPFGVALLGAAPASADGLFQDIFHGLDLAVTPLGSPVTTLNNGLRVNGARSGRVRVVPNRLGDGYRLELDRSFGPDDTGRPEIFDAGPYQMELSGAMQSTLGFTRRNFAGNDHHHNSFFIGNGNIAISNMNYAIRETSGAQDVELSGTINATGALEMNQLGFYTMSLDVANTNSQLTFDGVVVDGSTDADYNIGPINVKGNIFYDAALAALSSLGVDTTDLEQLFPSSPIDQITQNIQQSLAEQMGIIGENASAKGSAASLTALGPMNSMTEQLVSDVVAGRIDSSGDSPTGVPEPVSLVLLTLGAALAVRTARRL